MRNRHEKVRRCLGMLNPYCEECFGFGKVHPLKYDGKPNYSEAIMCEAEGCLRESYNKRALK